MGKKALSTMPGTLEERRKGWFTAAATLWLLDAVPCLWTIHLATGWESTVPDLVAGTVGHGISQGLNPSKHCPGKSAVCWMAD